METEVDKREADQLKKFEPEILDAAQKSDMDSLLDNLPPAEPTKAVPREDKPAVEPPVEQPAPEVPPVKQAETPPPAEEKPAEKDEIAEMREMLNTYARQLAASKEQPVEQPPVEGERTPSATVPKDIPKDIIKFLTQEEADILIDQPDVLNAVLTRVFYAAQESVLKSIPDTTRKAAQEQVAVLLRADRFYGANKDLVPYKDFTALVAGEIELQNPTWDIDKVYEETAKVTRARLRLGDLAEERTNTPPADTSPAFPNRQPGSRKPNSAPRVVDEQISEMEKMLDFERTGRM